MSVFDAERRVKTYSIVLGKDPLAATGGAIGIHGTVNDELNREGVNWTYGCISLLSRDIQELYGIVPVGTPVIIEH